MPLIREAFAHQRLTEETIKIMIASLSPSTLKQYDAAYKKLWTFCQNNNITDCFSISNPIALNFLTDQFKSGSSYSVINTIRSALSLLLGNRFSSDVNVCRFLKGVFRIRPCFPKYQCTWDTNVVLDFICKWHPNENLPLSTITKKLVVLLALSTAQRVQTLSIIRSSNIKITNTGIEIVIDDMIKTSAAGRPQPHLVIPFFNNKRQICPAHTLISYMEKTKLFRENANTDRLILTTKKPYHNATTSTISRWIKQTLHESGVDTNIYSAHSARHAATSAADRRGVPIDIIRKAAGWSGNSLVFAKFYNRPIATSNDYVFCNAIFDYSDQLCDSDTVNYRP